MAALILIKIWLPGGVYDLLLDARFVLNAYWGSATRPPVARSLDRDPGDQGPSRSTRGVARRLKGHRCGGGRRRTRRSRPEGRAAQAVDLHQGLTRLAGAAENAIIDCSSACEPYSQNLIWGYPRRGLDCIMCHLKYTVAHQQRSWLLESFGDAETGLATLGSHCLL